jgi:ABC-type molybdate transport system substrate-binding protein
VKAVRDLADAKIKFVAIAQPELAPYGKAALEALQASGVWEAVRRSWSTRAAWSAKQLAATGNADAAFTAYCWCFVSRGRCCWSKKADRTGARCGCGEPAGRRRAQVCCVRAGAEGARGAYGERLPH